MERFSVSENVGNRHNATVIEVKEMPAIQHTSRVRIQHDVRSDRWLMLRPRPAP